MGCACRPFSPPAAASAPPTTAKRFPSRRSDFSASSSLPVFPSVSADGSNRRLLVVSHCNSIRKLDFSFPPLFLRNPKTSAAVPPSAPLCPAELGGNNNDNGNNNNGGRGGGGGGWSNSFNSDDWLRGNQSAALIFLVSAVCSVGYFQFASAQARSSNGAEEEDVEVVWEVRGGKWIKLIGDHFRDTFVISTEESSWSSLVDGGVSGKPLHLAVVSNLWMQCRDVFMRLMLPEGYPHSVTSDYMEYCLWRGVQGVAAQISGVLATQSLLYAVGLGKGAIPTAAAVNWVLKDGIGYLSKILLSKFGRHFDVHPKGWRLFADLLENAAFGMEILTPAFPHLFVPIGAVAGAGRSAAALIQLGLRTLTKLSEGVSLSNYRIATMRVLAPQSGIYVGQAATRSCFYAGFAAQRNFAEVIAKGEAQGMVSKSIGIMLGIALANCVRSSTPLALASFGAITWIHMFCNLKSYQSIQIRTLNPYRASLIFSEYLLSGVVPSIKEVNDEEPLFPALPYLHLRPARNAQSTALSAEAKEAAAYIEDRLQLGSKLSDTVRNKDDAVALFDLYKDEGYILTEHEGRYCVALKESCSPQDMLKSVFQVSYLYWLEKHAGIKTHGLSEDCKPGGKMQLSLEYVQMEFNHAKVDGEVTGWVTDGLIARPSPIRIRPGC